MKFMNLKGNAMKTDDSIREGNVRLFKTNLARKMEKRKRIPESYPKYPRQQEKNEQNKKGTFCFVCDWQQP